MTRIVSAPLLAMLVVGPASRAMAQAADNPPNSTTDREVRTTILRGTGSSTAALLRRPSQVLPGGDIALNFPGVDVQAVAKAILGDILHVRYAVDPSARGSVTVRTAHPIRRADVLGFLEQSLSASNFVLADRGGTFTILPAATARGEAPVVGVADPGYGNETILKFVNAEELRKLLDPLVPNAITVTDPTQNMLVISGTSTQRRALRELVAQFDVDWLKGMSFGLFIPQRTDARLIAPELEKLLNAPGSPSAGLVRLISMDQLNGILAISSQAQYLDDVRRFVEILDREGESSERRVFVYHVQNGRASDLAKVLNSAFGNTSSNEPNTDINPTELVDRTAAPRTPQVLGANGLVTGLLARAVTAGQKTEGGAEKERGNPAANGTTITADETNNAIVVFSTPRDFALIEDALRKLDVPPLQVMIDATISEVTLNHQLQYGIQWSFQSGNNSAALTQVGPSGVTATLQRHHHHDADQHEHAERQSRTAAELSRLLIPLRRHEFSGDAERPEDGHRCEDALGAQTHGAQQPHRDHPGRRPGAHPHRHGCQHRGGCSAPIVKLDRLSRHRHHLQDHSRVNSEEASCCWISLRKSVTFCHSRRRRRALASIH